MAQIICANCGEISEKTNSHINRARKLNKSLYCSRVCFGLASRVNKTPAQLKEEKRLYDIQYRINNKQLLKENKSAYFHRTYDPEKAAIKRKENMHRHVEYCRTPHYKAYKKQYDRKYRAKQDYGEFWESAILSLEIHEEVESRMSQYQIKLESQTLNKCQRRKRNEQFNSKKLEVSTMGNPERG